jgi:hypothetical protein
LRKVNVFYADENNILRNFNGEIDERNKYVKVPLLRRLVRLTTIYYDERLRPVIFITPKSVETVNLKKGDSAEGDSFSTMAYDIISTKMLEILEEPSRRTILVVFIFGLMVGIILAQSYVLWMK